MPVSGSVFGTGVNSPDKIDNIVFLFKIKAREREPHHKLQDAVKKKNHLLCRGILVLWTDQPAAEQLYR